MDTQLIEGNTMSLSWDIEELFYLSLGKREDEVDEAINDGDLDEAIFEKYDCSVDTYERIVKDLINFTPEIKAGISGKSYQGFVLAEEQRFIVKCEPKK